ncbi:MAG: bifunctional diaminohydroxyphosphoribosylaminopyrimidine deaminase/5-amino-6-(5-phosphoribosylamino)uracil reductase RibD [Alphaproteobacteria bacterium]|nr:bifunctional diaminohydroxyphosphoribosylaminopyrimidine deaminase/5-amino-6-(5-phosphoribosylamino)uracil reductase RibD [Pseudomonadota bacterium]
MATALGLARRGLGRVWPNPSVGCVLVREGRIVGRGWTQASGRPHGEAGALAQAGAAARGASAYITLEPCAHSGETPPCADALIGAGIRRAVVALEDPDPRVDGKGLKRLREAGVEVALGCGAEEAAEINAGFLSRIRRARPLVTLKLASTLDGRIATHRGESQWITGEAARALAHRLRAENDAVMIGIGTALADDPRLTCRLPGLEARSPVRVVLDARLRLPVMGRLVSTAREVATWIVTLDDVARERERPYRRKGVEVIRVPADAMGDPDAAETLKALGARGLTRVLVEGGSVLAAALLGARLVDRIAWFRAPSIIGGDGIPATVAFGVEKLSDMPRFRRASIAALGPDLLESYREQS